MGNLFKEGKGKVFEIGTAIPEQQIAEACCRILPLFEAISPTLQQSKRRLQCLLNCLFPKNILRQGNDLDHFNEPLPLWMHLEEVGDHWKMPPGQGSGIGSSIALRKQMGIGTKALFPFFQRPGPERGAAPIHLAEQELERLLADILVSSNVMERIFNGTNNSLETLFHFLRKPSVRRGEQPF